MYIAMSYMTMKFIMKVVTDDFKQDYLFRKPDMVSHVNTCNDRQALYKVKEGIVCSLIQLWYSTLND